MSPLWSFVLTLVILSTLGEATFDGRSQIYLSPTGKRLWYGDCGGIFQPKQPSPCPLEDPCRIPQFPVDERPCNVHFLPGNYGDFGLYYYANLYDTPITEVNFTFGDVGDVGKSSISGLSISITLYPDLQARTPARLNFISANPSSNVVFKGGTLNLIGILKFNTFFEGIDFEDFQMSAGDDLINTVFPGSGHVSFNKCTFVYTKTALTLSVSPPRFFPVPKLDHFEVHFKDSKISANLANSEAFIVGSNLTELNLSMKKSHFNGGVLLQAKPGGNFKTLKFENSVISTSAQSLLVPSPQAGIGIFDSLEVLEGTRLHSSGNLFNFFPPGYPAHPGTSGSYSEQLMMHDVNLEGVAIRASLRDGSTLQPALKNVNCRDCSIYLTSNANPYFEGHSHFDLTSPTSSLHIVIASFTRLFHISQLSVYVKPELEAQRPFFLSVLYGTQLDGSLSTNMLALSPGYFQFSSKLNISQFVSTYTSGQHATIYGKPTSNVTLGSINAFNVALELELVSALNYVITDPEHGIQVSPDLLSPGVSIRLPKVVNVFWSPSLGAPALNKWYPLASFVDKLPERIFVVINDPVKGLQHDLALQPFKGGQQVVFRFRRMCRFFCNEEATGENF